MKSTDSPIVVTATIDAALTEVWLAITDATEMKKWYFDQIPDFQPTIDFETKFTVQVEDRSYTHLWKVTEVEPLHKITYRWQYAEYPGTAFVSFKLLDKGDQTHLTLTNVVTDDFPSNVPEFTRESCIGGWKYFIGDRLFHHFM